MGISVILNRLTVVPCMMLVYLQNIGMLLLSYVLLLNLRQTNLLYHAYKDNYFMFFMELMYILNVQRYFLKLFLVSNVYLSNCSLQKN